MADQRDELTKLIAIATDLGLAEKLRTKAIEQIGHIGTHEALRGLLDLAANEKLSKGERELTLKYAKDIIRSER